MSEGPLQKSIIQIMPAPGWKAYCCWLSDDGSARFDEVPVVGWGVVRHQREDVDGFNDGVELFIFDEYARSIEDTECDADNATYIHVGPGAEFDVAAKAAAEKSTRQRLAWSEARQAKRKEVGV